MPNILITGGAGFIGSSLANELAKNPELNITVVDNLITGSAYNIEKRSNLHFIKADVNKHSDISSVFYSHKFDFVFHYAALVGVKRTLQNPIKVLNDVTGIKNIMHLSKSTEVKRVYFSSSSEVYGEPVEFPQNEDTTPLNSKLPYAIVKNLGEAFLKSYNKEYDLEYVIFRFFNTYGPSQTDDFVVNRFISAALKNENIAIYGDGSQTRTFCYVTDNIEATKKVFLNNLFVNDVINIGNDVETSVLELAEKIIKLSNSKSKIIHLPKLIEGDMTRRKPDINKMKKVLNHSLIDIDQGLKKIIDIRLRAGK